MDEMNYILKRYSLMESSGTETYFDADEIVDLLDHFEEADDFDHYEKVLELGQKLHPENQDIKIRTCRAFIYREEYDTALRAIERIGDPEDMELNLLKMECFCALDRFDEVRAFVEAKQEENSEELEEIFEYLAPVMNELNRFDEAAALLQHGLALFPDNLILKEEYCYYLEMQGQPQQALAICNELIDADPYSVDYWYMQGRLCLTQGDYDKAVDALDFALACDDSDVEIKVMKAYCLFMNEHYEKAIDVYLELLSEGHCNQEIQPCLAECYMKSEHFEQAYTIFKELIEDTDIARGLMLYKNYIRCCLETGRESEASKILPEMATRFPEDLLLLTLQAFVHLVTGEQDEAVEIAEHILDLVYQTAVQGNRMPEMLKNMHSLGQSVKQLIEAIHRLTEPQLKKSYLPVHQAISCLVKGDMKRFCRKYANCPPEMVAGYLHRIFSVIRGLPNEPRPTKTGFLQASEIHLQPAECVASAQLSSSYLTNGYHNN
ncbi:MAG: tetratricopeptide repeat protein [Tannerella sp.]|jgi:tetratricopeptide (TPR) repeat protein|nr:tetratricopeptide repeat protein [Tannerella sp.]